MQAINNFFFFSFDLECVNFKSDSDCKKILILISKEVLFLRANLEVVQHLRDD